MNHKLNGNEPVVAEFTVDRIGMAGTRGSTGKLTITSGRILYYPRIPLTHDDLSFGEIKGYKTWKVLGLMPTGLTIVMKDNKEIKYASPSRNKIAQVLKKYLTEIK